MPGISDLLHSDMESDTNFIDENSLISSISDTTNIATTKAAPAKRTKKRKCVTMPKRARTTKVAVKAEPDQPSQIVGAKRKAKTIDAGVGEDDPCEVEQPTTKPKVNKSSGNHDVPRPSNKATKAKQNKKTNASVEVDEDEAIPSPVVMRSNFATGKATKAFPRPVTEGNAKKPSARAQKAVTKTTENAVSEAEDEDDINTVEQQPPRKRVRTESRTRQEPSYRRRAGSVSDTERGDPLLRRKLGDITRKFENIDTKYRNLKNVAMSEANSNFEKLRREHDQIIDTTNKLVTSLKQQLAQQAPIVQEYQKSKKEVSSQESENRKLQAVQVELSSSLTAAQNEIKALKAKLAAAKIAPAPTAAPVEPKAAVAQKTVLPPNKVVAGTTSELSHKQQLKLDLYSDLTGLIIRDVKQSDEGDTFDCIQTGRDGRALHFKLHIDAEELKKSNHDEQEFLYTPLLDAGRDRDLIEIMPGYLTEDITFAREVAARFYGRVVETVTRKVEVDSDQGDEDADEGEGDE